MIAKDKIIDIMRQIAPENLADDFDNVGMLVDINDNINGVIVALDVTKSVVDEAKEKGVNLIISHHPIIFDPLKRIGLDDVVYHAIKNGISVYSSHTNMDLVHDGLNEKLADLLGLKDTTLLSLDDRENAYGRVGKISRPVSLEKFSKNVKKALDIPSLRVMGDKKRMISCVAVSTGSGAGFASIANALGADVFITAEVKHNIHLDYIEQNICIIDAGHYDTEKHFVNMVIKSLQAALSDIQCSLNVFASDNENRPYWTI